jgi:peptide chain release factor 2
MTDNAKSMIDPAHLKVETYPLIKNRGGQHVALTPTGIQVTHLPSGIMAIVDIGRSQHRNRQIAMEMILAAITHPDYR